MGKKKNRKIERGGVKTAVKAPRAAQRSGLATQSQGMRLLEMLGVGAKGEPVTMSDALGIPAVWAAVNFIPNTIASLPLKVYRKTKDGRVEVDDPLAGILSRAINEETTSHAWRKHKFTQVLTGGRGFSFIDRNANGQILNIWPLEPAGVTVKRANGRKTYEYREAGGEPRVFDAADIIDIPYLLKSDGLSSYSPLVACNDVLRLAIDSTRFASRYFRNGGVPPFVIEGPFNTPAGIQRASDDLEKAIEQAAQQERQAMALPLGHTVKEIGGDPAKGQYAELQQSLVVQIARIYGLPPVFLQDLTHGTFSNTEQQDLILVKHVIAHWLHQFEQELNLKIFGRRSRNKFVAFKVEGLLRGDFRTRMEGYATGVQNAIYKPNEIRAWENLPSAEQGDDLMVQGATVPLGSQPMAPDQNPSEDAQI